MSVHVDNYLCVPILRYSPLFLFMLYQFSEIH